MEENCILHTQRSNRYQVLLYRIFRAQLSKVSLLFIFFSAFCSDRRLISFEGALSSRGCTFAHKTNEKIFSLKLLRFFLFAILCALQIMDACVSCVCVSGSACQLMSNRQSSKNYITIPYSQPRMTRDVRLWGENSPKEWFLFSSLRRRHGIGKYVRLRNMCKNGWAN